MAVHQKLKHKLVKDPSIPLQSIYPNILNQWVQQIFVYLYLHQHYSDWAKGGSHPTPMDRWTDKMRYMYKEIKEIKALAMIYMSRKGIMLMK